MVAHSTHILWPRPLLRRVLKFCGGRKFSLFSKNDSIHCSGSFLSPPSTSTHIPNSGRWEAVKRSLGAEEGSTPVSEMHLQLSACLMRGGKTPSGTGGSGHTEAGAQTQEREFSENRAELGRLYKHRHQIKLIKK